MRGTVVPEIGIVKNAWLMLCLPLTWHLLAAEKEPAAEDIRIAPTPQAAAKAERRDNLELYGRMLGGDPKARKAWKKLKQPQRTLAVADAAVTIACADRKQALVDLAFMSAGDDPDAAGLAALARVAVADKDGGLREFARNALIARNDPRAVKPLATALHHADPLFRGNAAAALKAIGGPRVFEVIIEHWKEVWGASNRAHCFFGTTQSYVADYDISGDSYDPVVRSFLTGVVLDSKVIRIESDVYYITIREVAGGDVKLPNNPVAWKKWLERERDKLAEEAEKKREAALAALKPE